MTGSCSRTPRPTRSKPGEAETEKARQTPFEVEATKRSAKAAKPVKRLPNAREWNLLVTLLWIGSRDFEWMASHIVASQTAIRRSFDGMSAGGLVSWAKTCLEQLPEPVASNPEKKLLDRLVSGSVSASGLELGIAPRRNIPREQWLDLHFARGGPDKHNGLSCAYSGDPSDPRSRARASQFRWDLGRAR